MPTISKTSAGGGRGAHSRSTRARRRERCNLAISPAQRQRPRDAPTGHERAQPTGQELLLLLLFPDHVLDWHAARTLSQHAQRSAEQRRAGPGGARLGAEKRGDVRSSRRSFMSLTSCSMRRVRSSRAACADRQTLGSVWQAGRPAGACDGTCRCASSGMRVSTVRSGGRCPPCTATAWWGEGRLGARHCTAA
jgi:hypothetical protein